MTGRGAWTKIGKDNDSYYYEYFLKRPKDGSTPEVSPDYYAVNLGVKSIQARLAELGFDAGISNFQVSGIFDRATKRAARAFQNAAFPGAGATANDGTVGTRTAPELFKGYMAGVADSYTNVDVAMMYGVVCQESGFDPGAVGVFTPGDHGLFQFNTLNGTVSVEQAHDYDVATAIMAERLHNAYKQFTGKGPLLRKQCMIAQHNSPVWAQEWFDTQVPPSPLIESYVTNVIGYAAKYVPAVVG